MYVLSDAARLCEQERSTESIDYCRPQCTARVINDDWLKYISIHSLRFRAMDAQQKFACVCLCHERFDASSESARICDNNTNSNLFHLRHNSVHPDRHTHWHSRRSKSNWKPNEKQQKRREKIILIIIAWCPVPGAVSLFASTFWSYFMPFCSFFYDFLKCVAPASRYFLIWFDCSRLLFYYNLYRAWIMDTCAA